MRFLHALLPARHAGRLRQAAAVVTLASGLVTAAHADDASLALGKKVYMNTCFACHGTGAAGSPMVGNAAQWAPFAKKGIDAMVADAIAGVGSMPPRGGAPNATDAQIRAAIEYMLSQSHS